MNQSTLGAVKERPLLLGAPWVRAILAGRKTQTRRVIFRDGDNHMPWRVSGTHWQDGDDMLRCPFGEVGDRLWVRETWGLWDTQPSDGPENARKFYRATDGERPDLHYQLWRPSIHMPRWASRIDLEVTGVRAERLQSLSEADAIAEGFSVDTCSDILRRAAGKARMEFGRWLEMPDHSEPDGYWCVRCVHKQAKKLGASVCGWNDCFEYDHAPRCEECGVMLYHSLTDYGIQTELGMTDEVSTLMPYAVAEGDSALALAELAEGMGAWTDEYAGRLAQVWFATAWNQLGAHEHCRWEDNPWVWVITFRRLEGVER